MTGFIYAAIDSFGLPALSSVYLHSPPPKGVPKGVTR